MVKEYVVKEKVIALKVNKENLEEIAEILKESQFKLKFIEALDSFAFFDKQSLVYKPKDEYFILSKSDDKYIPIFLNEETFELLFKER